MGRATRLAFICLLLISCSGAKSPSSTTRPPSPKVDAASLDYDPTVDGFGIPNEAGGGPPAALTVNGVRTLFGDDAICAEIAADGACTPFPVVLQYVKQVNRSMSSGLCEGFASLSLLLANDPKSLTARYSGTTVSGLGESPQLLYDLALYYSTQFTPDVQQKAEESRSSPVAIAERLADDFRQASTKGTAAYTLGIYGDQGGHALTPYAVTPTDDGYAISVYDSNHPTEVHAVEINTSTDRWRYDLGGGVIWEGDGQTIEIVPMSVRLGEHPCPFCESTSNGTMIAVSADGSTPTAVVETEDGSIGYGVDGVFRNTIEGAKYRIIPASNSDADSLLLILPPEATKYRLAAETGGKAVSVAGFSPEGSYQLTTTNGGDLAAVDTASGFQIESLSEDGGALSVAVGNTSVEVQIEAGGSAAISTDTAGLAAVQTDASGVETTIAVEYADTPTIYAVDEIGALEETTVTPWVAKDSDYLRAVADGTAAELLGDAYSSVLTDDTFTLVSNAAALEVPDSYWESFATPDLTEPEWLAADTSTPKPTTTQANSTTTTIPTVIVTNAPITTTTAKTTEPPTTVEVLPSPPPEASSTTIPSEPPTSAPSNGTEPATTSPPSSPPPNATTSTTSSTSSPPPESTSTTSTTEPTTTSTSTSTSTSTTSTSVSPPSCGPYAPIEIIGTLGGGDVWGSGPFTDDSNIARAAVFAGLVEVGETATIEFYDAQAYQTFSGATANGVTTSDWDGEWCGFRIRRAFTSIVRGTASEGSLLTLTAPDGYWFTGVVFASYGTPYADPEAYGGYRVGDCHASDSEAIVTNLVYGRTRVHIAASNGLFGDPCGGTYKSLAVALSLALLPDSPAVEIQSAGFDSLSGWTVDQNGGNGVLANGALRFSYGMGVVHQAVAIHPTATHLHFEIDVDNSQTNSIGNSTPRPDEYSITLSAGGESNSTTVRTAHGLQTVTLDLDIPIGTESAVITLSGIDRGFWAGHYGPIMDDATLTATSPSGSTNILGLHGIAIVVCYFPLRWLRARCSKISRSSRLPA